jgi:hypothetical protein
MTNPEGTPAAVEGKEPGSSWLWTEHLGTGLTLGYLALIVIGIFHEAVLLFRFRINVLDYAEPSDFLLAPIRDPLVILATLVPIVAIYYYLRGAEIYGQRLRAKRAAQGLPPRKWLGDPEKASKNRVPLFTVTILIWVVASGLHYERWAADRLRKGLGTRVRVELTSGEVEGGTAASPVLLLGSTSRFFFLYRLADRQTVIVPSENVLRILPELKVKALKARRGAKPESSPRPAS